ncbi:MAG: phosphatase PAP2 family protein [Planctomycetes bacterium]|nr:phosphatase PAP2 family protein [Planctomycetota bacterium]
MFRIRARMRQSLVKRPAFKPCLEALEGRVLLSADMVLRWNAVALDAVKNDYAVGHTPDQGGPTRAARALAIVQAAIYDAVESVDHTYAQYVVHMNAPSGTSMEAAAAMAGHDTLVALFPHQRPMFDKALFVSLIGINPVAALKGMFIGHQVSQAMLTARQNDGSPNPMPYTPGTNPGDWQPDPLHPTQQALTPGWGSVTPFAMTSGDQFQVPPPPDLTSPEYAAAYNQVMAIGGDGVHTPTTRTAEQTTIGIFWGYDGSPGIGVPPRLYNQIARVIAQQQGNTEVQNARLFALLNIAMADAGIAVWNTKYVDNFWRPITAIRAGDTDGNAATTADPTWTPLGAPADNGGGTNFTPPFPAYTSGHAGFGAAAFGILRDFYGTDNVSFSFTSDEFNGKTRDQNGVKRPVVTRHFTSFSEAAEENGQSRIYLGIHWIFDKVQGIAEGTNIADWTFSHVMGALAHPSQTAVATPTTVARTSAAYSMPQSAFQAQDPILTHSGVDDRLNRSQTASPVGQASGTDNGGVRTQTATTTVEKIPGKGVLEDVFWRLS